MILSKSCFLNKPKVKDVSKYALVDLHLHVDGSMTPADVLELARVGGVSLPTYDIEELRGMLEVPKHGLSLRAYLDRFRLPLAVMQTRRTISLSVSRLIRRLDAAGLIYAELRFAPQQHTAGGLTQAEVVEAAIEGLNESISSGFKAQLILCCMRGSGNEEANRETARLAALWLGKGVCAADLAGAEADFPTAGYAGLCAYMREIGVPFTIHAGEAVGPESVMLALDYGASRIGHGIRCYNDPLSKARLREMGVPLEICPTSNLDTRALPSVTRFEDYPIQDFIRDGVTVTINTDNMAVSATTLAAEFSGLMGGLQLSESDAVQCVRNAVAAAFLPEAEKNALLALAMSRITL